MYMLCKRETETERQRQRDRERDRDRDREIERVQILTDNGFKLKSAIMAAWI